MPLPSQRDSHVWQGYGYRLYTYCRPCYCCLLFVEMASVDNMKRTWVNYGGARECRDPERSDPTQEGEGGGEEGGWSYNIIRGVCMY